MRSSQNKNCLVNIFFTEFCYFSLTMCLCVRHQPEYSQVSNTLRFLLSHLVIGSNHLNNNLKQNDVKLRKKTFLTLICIFLCMS